MKKLVEFKREDTLFELIQGGVADLEVDAIMNPTSKYLDMNEGASLEIMENAGTQIKHETSEKAYGCNIGESIITSAGNLRPKIKYIIHAPVRNEARENFNRNRILSAVRAVMQKAYESWMNLDSNMASNKIKSLGFIGIGTESDQVSKKKAAKALVDGIMNQLNNYYIDNQLEKIVFCYQDPNMIQLVKNELESLREIDH